MESFFVRYKDPLILMAVLFVQIIALATQVKRTESPVQAGSGGTRLIRVWTMSAITPVEKLLTGTGRFFRGAWGNYIDLHGARRENRELKEQLDRMKLDQAQLRAEVEQTHRLEVLLDFRQRVISKTVAAQVIGSSGSERSRIIYIDRGSHDGIKRDMAVITPDGIVGKVKDVFPRSSQVLLINDRDSGAGVVLEKSRLQGVLRGNEQGELQITDIMSDENVHSGEPVVTSGGDSIYPRGLPVGTVMNAAADHDSEPFLRIGIRPAAKLDQLEDVLVITQMAEHSPSVAEGSPSIRAADVLAQRLPSITKPPDKDKEAGQANPAQANSGQPNSVATGQQTPPASPLQKKTEVPRKSAGAVESTPGQGNKPPVKRVSPQPRPGATQSTDTPTGEKPPQ
ncbi:MAG TPA: rod shape-determining protein MreC [Candidatus Angelobacter sp.]|nr:rod shape-determining protein MreC [Candidatus Angelobacter sp.]